MAFKKLKHLSKYKPITVQTFIHPDTGYKHIRGPGEGVPEYLYNSETRIMTRRDISLTTETIDGPFETTLEFINMFDSYKRVHLYSENQNTMYTMVTKDFETLMQEKRLPVFPGNKWTTTWFVRKYMNGYSIFHTDLHAIK